MARKGEMTRKSIMDTAETLIMEQGYSATSIDQILAGAGITKGSFFYHFPTKTDLAHALAERYARRDIRQLTDKMAAAAGQAALPSLHSPFWAPQADKVIASASEAMTVLALDILKEK